MWSAHVRICICIPDMNQNLNGDLSGKEALSRKKVLKSSLKNKDKLLSLPKKYFAYP